MSKHKLKIIPLGGLGEIGKNMMAIEYEDDIIVIDAGLMFPEEEMMGVDLVIPDIAYLLENKTKLRGIIITHGHEDHIGALPYILPEIDLPIYATKLTEGLISVKLKERSHIKKARFNTIRSGDKFYLGKFEIEPFLVCHSIPDSVGLIIKTPIGTIVHSGDFKIDYTPVDGKPSELAKLAQLGGSGTLLLLADSTYSDLPGYTPSETVVGDTLKRIIAEAPGRVIIATFASLISRVQQIFDAADKYQRYVAIIGRSMKDTVKMASDLGYLKIPSGVLKRSDELVNLPHNRIVLLTTGSQGEPTSALVRITNRENSQIKIVPRDTVVISATPIPGNEALVNRIIDNLFRQGAQVIYERLAQVHVHGHASQEELKLLLNLVKPKFFVPIHGEYRHMCLHAKLAAKSGVSQDNIFVIEDGDVLEIDQNKGRVTTKLSISNVYIDGSIMRDMAGSLLKDRKLLSRDGIVVAALAISKETSLLVGQPEIISKGFVDTKTGESILMQGQNIIAETFESCPMSSRDPAFIKTKIKEALTRFFHEHTRRRPLMHIVIIEV